MATVETETKTPESLRGEIVFLLSQIEDAEFLTALRLIARDKVSSNKKPVTWESLPEELRKQIEEGEADIAAGRVYSSEEVFGEIEKWLEKS